MHILVKTVTGLSVDLNVEGGDSIRSLYDSVMEMTGVPCEEQRLISQGKLLTEGSIFENELSDNSTVYLVVSLDGGAKGKKKKKDTKKGKKKHKKKKVKLAILKYYKVTDGSVVRLRQMCKVCPPGTFIAEHPDRLYCGRCHTAYQKLADTKKGAAGAKDQGKAKAKK